MDESAPRNDLRNLRQIVAALNDASVAKTGESLNQGRDVPAPHGARVITDFENYYAQPTERVEQSGAT